MSQSMRAKLWEICSLMYSVGIAQSKYFHEIIPFLLLKVCKEKNKEYLLPEGYRWDDITNEKTKWSKIKTTLSELQRDNFEDWEEVEDLILKDIMTGKNNETSSLLLEGSDSEYTFKKILTMIGETEWSPVIGDVYEYLLRKTYSELSGTHGQHFTPRDMVDLSFDISKELVEIESEDFSVADLAMGTGGFLVPYIEANPKAKIEAIELIPQTFRAGKFNLLSHNMDESNLNIVPGSSLDGETFDKLAKVDLIVGNPPFRSGFDKKQCTINEAVPVKSGKIQFNFLGAKAAKMKKDGHMVLVVPNDIFFANGKAEASIRDKFFKENKLLGIVNLGTGLFENTGVATSLIVVKEGEGTSDYWLYDLSYQKYTLTNRIAKEDHDNIIEIVKGNIIISDHFDTFVYDKEDDIEYEIKEEIVLRTTDEIHEEITNIFDLIKKIKK